MTQGADPAMTDNPANPARDIARWPTGPLGMLVLVAVIELILAGRHLDFTTVTATDWRRTGEAASTKALGRDVLCFGDSLVKFGVLPRVIEAKTGLKAFNLAINAGPMPAEYFLLRRALDAGAKPKAIVADFFALMLPDQPRVAIRAYPELASLRDCLDLAQTTRDADLMTAILLGKFLPSVRSRFEIRASVAAAFDGRRASPWPASRQVWTAWKEQLGAQPMPAAPGRPDENRALVGSLTPDHWTLDPINAAYFERFVALAESRQIPVFWIMPPLGPEVQAGRAARGTDAAYGKFARQAQTRFPDLIVLDARNSGYDGSTHIDPIHLNVGGATVLSGDIALAVAGHLNRRTSARWSNLPLYPGRTTVGSPTAVAVGASVGSAR